MRRVVPSRCRKNRRGPAPDRVLLLQPLRFAPEPQHLRFFRLARRRRFGRARRREFGWSDAEPADARSQLGGHFRRPAAALRQPHDRLRLDCRREPPPGPLLRRVALLRCLGSLTNPPLPGGRPYRYDHRGSLVGQGLPNHDGTHDGPRHVMTIAKEFFGRRTPTKA